LNLSSSRIVIIIRSVAAAIETPEAGSPAAGELTMDLRGTFLNSRNNQKIDQSLYVKLIDSKS
jgi:hypothetical protein